MRYSMPARPPIVDPEFRDVKEPHANAEILARIRNAAKRTDIAPSTAVIRGCTIKKQFPSIADAQTTADRIAQESGTVLRPYQCKVCRQVHLTSKKAE